MTDRDARLRLTSLAGPSAVVSTRGATLVSLTAPDREGRYADVVLGFDSDVEYAAHPDLYFGATIGRVANRIRDARFDLDGRTWQLAANEGRHHLHGGATRSFDRVEWTVRAAGPDAVELGYVSPDGEEGYPGRVEVRVRYRLDADTLSIDLAAEVDRPTPLNLTNHTYWNLAGPGADGAMPSVLDHVLRLAASRFTPTDEDLIPLGTVAPVEGTPLDLRTPRALRERIGELEAAPAGGYDHNVVLDGSRPEDEPAAVLSHQASGRVLELRTTQPCLQLYSGNRMQPVVGKGGTRYGIRSGVCLEAQGYPDAVHHPAFPSVIVHPGVGYGASIALRLTTLREEGDGPALGGLR